ncbi:heat shock protein, alpha-crystallin-related, b15 [Rhinichthys klamathensis goyatoka]|uniref:heat shock protein, alpha-crystallin-related, b15 n=1 Tax=Rhinichthys klamathensis goyatoka TaxID=3034132 RepID=UPI0024B62105|nr:heat shock protein, alpha-crystallin-related, b15 [Rhinichthys klamathensis goyatoka]
MPRPLFYRNACWDPLQEGTHKNLFNQNTDLPCFLKPDEVSWIDSARKRLGTSTWPGSMGLPLFSSLCMDIPAKSCIGREGRHSESVCEQMKGQQNWKVCLDVSPYSPEDISIKTKEGYLEITGNHEERHDNHKLISRSFTRKYKLPADLDLKLINSMLSPDGILSVEVPLPGSTSLPGEIVIPIHMMDKQLPAK